MLTEANRDAQPILVGPDKPAPTSPIAIGKPAGEQVAIALQGITKRFNNTYALRNICITVQQGEVFGLLGPTGSGKTTLARLLLSFLQPDEGNISVFGSTDPLAVKARTGYMPQHPRYHHTFAGRDYLYVQARLSGLTCNGARKASERAIELVGLGPAARRQIRYYERETMQRLALAVAIVSIAGESPGLLILDEPSNYLSRGALLSVRDIILDFKQKGTTVLILSHRITEIERTATSVGILRRGELLAQTSVENDPRTVIVAVPRDSTPESYRRMVAYLGNLNPFVTITGGANGAAPLVVSLPSGSQIANAAGTKASALRALMDAGWEVISVYAERKDLEGIYAQAAMPRSQNGRVPKTGPLSPPNPATLPELDAGGTSTELPPGPPTVVQSMNGHNNTRPLHASETSHLENDEPPVSLNGHQTLHRPIEGRSLRKEDA